MMHKVARAQVRIGITLELSIFIESLSFKKGLFSIRKKYSIHMLFCPIDVQYLKTHENMKSKMISFFFFFQNRKYFRARCLKTSLNTWSCSITLNSQSTRLTLYILGGNAWPVGDWVFTIRGRWPRRSHSAQYHQQLFFYRRGKMNNPYLDRSISSITWKIRVKYLTWWSTYSLSLTHCLGGLLNIIYYSSP